VRKPLPVEVKSPITGNVWKILKAVGDTVEEYDLIMILESMKMEIPVEAPRGGQIVEIKVKEGESVIEEDVVALLE
jgi:acetyl-CoA carboxylase biotin carboxyl carrier protein